MREKESKKIDFTSLEVSETKALRIHLRLPTSCARQICLEIHAGGRQSHDVLSFWPSIQGTQTDLLISPIKNYILISILNE